MVSILVFTVSRVVIKAAARSLTEAGSVAPMAASPCRCGRVRHCGQACPLDWESPFMSKSKRARAERVLHIIPYHYMMCPAVQLYKPTSSLTNLVIRKPVYVPSSVCSRSSSQLQRRIQKEDVRPDSVVDDML